MTPRFLSGARRRVARRWLRWGGLGLGWGTLRARTGRIRVPMPIGHTRHRSCKPLDRGGGLTEAGAETDVCPRLPAALWQQCPGSLVPWGPACCLPRGQWAGSCRWLDTGVPAIAAESEGTPVSWKQQGASHLISLSQGPLGSQRQPSLGNKRTPSLLLQEGGTLARMFPGECDV